MNLDPSHSAYSMLTCTCKLPLHSFVAYDLASEEQARPSVQMVVGVRLGAYGDSMHVCRF